jgi:SAM-dependent methyltransferase
VPRGNFLPELTGFLAAWLPPAPARVLDIGSGAGAFTHHLIAQGYDAVGLDPIAPEEPPFARGRLEDLRKGVRPLCRTTVRFDAAIAIRSLHHVDDLDEALDALAGALRPGARIVGFEFAVEAMDDAALRWLSGHGIEADGAPHEIFTLAEVRAALDRHFRPLHFEPALYHALDWGRPDLRDAERAAIAGGEIPPGAAYMVHEH